MLRRRCFIPFMPIAVTVSLLEGVPLESDKRPSAIPNSPSLYETVRANFLQQQRHQNADNTAGIGEATAGATAAAGATA